MTTPTLFTLTIVVDQVDADGLVVSTEAEEHGPLTGREADDEIERLAAMYRRWGRSVRTGDDWMTAVGAWETVWAATSRVDPETMERLASREAAEAAAEAEYDAHVNR